MIDVYVGSLQQLKQELSDKLQINNNAWFNQRFCDEKSVTPEMSQVIERIEGGKYLGNNQFASRFEGGFPVSIKYLSTGCKTVLNCLAYPDIVFFAEEAGDNALEAILNLTEAKICFFSGPPRLYSDIQNDFSFHFLYSGNTFKCNRYSDVFKGGTTNGKHGNAGTKT